MKYLYKVWSFRSDDEYGEIYHQFEGNFFKFDEAMQKLKKLEEEKVHARFYRYKEAHRVSYEPDDGFKGNSGFEDKEWIDNGDDDWLDQVKSLGITE